MTRKEILEELKKFPTAERITIIEAALHLIHEGLQQIEQPLTKSERNRQLTKAAEALLFDYSNESELTAFTALDVDGFHA